MADYRTLQAEARDYYRLVRQADSLGIPTSLDDPTSPKTVQALRDAIRGEEMAAEIEDRARERVREILPGILALALCSGWPDYDDDLEIVLRVGLTRVSS